MTPMEWRNKHHRCRYCKYLTLKIRGFPESYIYICIVKDKVFCNDKLTPLKGMFCRVFKSKEFEE